VTREIRPEEPLQPEPDRLIAPDHVEVTDDGSADREIEGTAKDVGINAKSHGIGVMRN
jgi:hypothetical protein